MPRCLVTVYGCTAPGLPKRTTDSHSLTKHIVLTTGKMIRRVAIVFCLLAYWNICCHGETKSLKESGGVSQLCKDVNPDTAIMKREITVSTLKENSTGDWVTTFQADRDLEDSTTAVNLKIRQELVRCGEDKRMVLRITGVMRDNDGESYFSKLQNITLPETKEEKKDMSVNVDANKRGNVLRFHSELKGDNVLITNDGTTASRIELGKDNAAVVTERPLKDDEIFSVRIDESDESISKRIRTTPVFGLILNPNTNIRTAYNYAGKDGAWCLSWGDVFNQTFGKTMYSFHLEDIPDGTVLGVTRKKNGDVHFFKDGVEMGLAFERVPYGIHGVFEVVKYVTQISLVNE